MKTENLWSLRLGFSAEEAPKIRNLGFETFLDRSLNRQPDLSEPNFLKDTPQTLAELQEMRQDAKENQNAEKIGKILLKSGLELKAWWVERLYKAEFPLREKMNLFWHNHFVATLQNVKVPFWIFQHYRIIDQHSFGNYKTLVKEMMYSNALLKYLDNNQNRKGKINENLGRELLELFTLGEGNYTENDIKNTALTLAGLTVGEQKGEYRRFLKDNSEKTVFGKTGNFTIDEVIDIIFEQKNTPFFITRKILKWFIYDTPPEELVREYGEKLKALDYELKPFLNSVFQKEYSKETAGSQIKNPLLFAVQIFKELGIQNPNFKLLAFWIRNQGMDLFDQPNVKGWDGGKFWLTSQIYLNRSQFVDFLTIGNKTFAKRLEKQLEKFEVGSLEFEPNLDFNKESKPQEIIQDLTDRLIFQTNEELNADVNAILKYDFNPKAENAHENVLRLFNYLAKTPEFQIV